MKGNLWKKLLAAGSSGMMLFGVPANIYAEEFSSVQEVFSAPEALTGSGQEDEFISEAETDIPALADAYLPYISTVDLPDGKMGDYYSAQLEGISNNGRSLKWSIKDAGTLPAGISLSADGLLYGTPWETGSFVLQVLADNTEAVSTQRLEFNIYKADSVIKPYEIQLDRETIDLGIHPLGEQGRSFIVLQNKGQNPLHVKSLPQCDYFTLEWKNEQEDYIAPGGSANIRVISREGLAAGDYVEKINIETEEGISAQVAVKIHIGAASQKEYD